MQPLQIAVVLTLITALYQLSPVFTAGFTLPSFLPFVATLEVEAEETGMGWERGGGGEGPPPPPPPRPPDDFE